MPHPNTPYRNYELLLVTYLDVGNFCDKSTETTLHEMFLDFPITAIQANPYR